MPSKIMGFPIPLNSPFDCLGGWTKPSEMANETLVCNIQGRSTWLFCKKIHQRNIIKFLDERLLVLVDFPLAACSYQSPEGIEIRGRGGAPSNRHDFNTDALRLGKALAATRR